MIHEIITCFTVDEIMAAVAILYVIGLQPDISRNKDTERRGRGEGGRRERERGRGYLKYLEQ